MKSSFKYNFLLSIYQTFKNSDTLIPWRENQKPPVRALLITPSYATEPYFSFIGGGNRSTLRNPPTCRKSSTNFST
jgi:hypothetical protein